MINGNIPGKKQREADNIQQHYLRQIFNHKYIRDNDIVLGNRGQVSGRDMTVAPVSFAPIATSNWVQEYMGTGAFAVALDRFTTGSLEGSLAKAVELWKDECDYAEERFESYLQ